MNKPSEHKTSKYSSNWWFILLFGIFVRILLFLSGFHKTFARRVEINSPITSWYRVTECMTLSDHGLSPYDGDICHQPPLLVMLFQQINNIHVHWFFVILDVMTSLMLFFGAKVFVKLKLSEQEENKKTFATDISVLLLDENKLHNVPLLVMAIYLFNPYSILTCVSQSTVVLNNFINACVFFTMLTGWYSSSCVFVTISSYLSFYPVMLLVPVYLLILKYSKKPFSPLLLASLITVVSSLLLLFLSHTISGSWNFVHAVYGFVLEVPDLTPNMGLFWYFFMEMFDHFRLFFLWVYQINAFIYVVPLVIVFRKQPILIFYTLLSIIALFKSYSTFGDVALPMALLPLWSYAYRYLRNVLLIFGMFLFTTVLAPLMWHLWIYAGSGNANFYYAVTLAYNTAQIFLLTDVLYATLRFDYHLKHGMSPKTLNGKEGIVIMK